MNFYLVYYVFGVLIHLFFGANATFYNRPCHHLHPKPHEVIHNVHIEPAHIMKKRSIDQPLRIALHYDDSIKRLTEEKIRLINDTVLPDAIQFWQRALMVRRTENVIRLSRKCKYNQVFSRVDAPYSYCKASCKEKTMCGEVEVPEEHLDVCRTCNEMGRNCTEHGQPGEGIIGADFVFYVSAMTTERCNKGLTVAYATHCQQESSLDRPIAGHANFCPNSISTKPQELEILKYTVKHEILHALGFSISLFAFYRDAEGEPLTPREVDGKPLQNSKYQVRQWSDRIIKTITRPDWSVRGGNITKEVEMIVTPRVLKEVRNHFNCSILEGAELEDQGEEGTVLTHWEKRVFENEAMTGTHTQKPVFSRLTLALMEDTGWYIANYSMADPLTWGRSLGCDFVTKSCKSWMETKHAQGHSIHPFCNKVKRDPLETECSDDRTSVALCNLVKYPDPLPSVYQNFEYIPHIIEGEEEYYGGVVSLADFCPYIQEFTWRSQNIVIRGSQCQFTENNPPNQTNNFALEEYGNQSRCFDHTDNMWEQRNCTQARQWLHWGSGCYRYSCKGGRLNIIVNNLTYPCYYPKQVLNISVIVNGWLHIGALICPACEEICEKEFTNTSEACLPSQTSLVPSYHMDHLKCCGNQNKQVFNFFSLIIVSCFFIKSF